MPSVNEFLQNERVDRLATLEDYKEEVIRELVPILQSMADDIRQTLNARHLTSHQERRIVATLREINRQLAAGYKQLGRELGTELRELIKAEIGYSATLLNESVGVAFANRPTINQIYAAAKAQPFNGKLLSKYYEDIPRSVADRIEAQIRIGYGVGETAQQIQTRVRPILTSDMVNWTKTLTRDAVTHFQIAANQGVYQQNANVLKGVQWTSTLDTKTSEICSRNDTKIFPTEEMGRIPAHHNCRSDWTPVLKSWKAVDIRVPEQRRNSMDGLVPDDLSYGPWLRNQSVARQEERLGKSAARLFREGELPIEKFSTRLGRPFTLQELRQKNPQTWNQVFGPDG